MIMSTLRSFRCHSRANDLHIISFHFISNRNFPDLLKLATFIPKYKNGERNLPSNYQPISMLSIFDKILVKLMIKRLSNFLEANKIL